VRLPVGLSHRAHRRWSDVSRGRDVHPGKLVVPGDAATTANAILAHKHLFELGFSLMLIALTCSIVLTALFYDLFKPVNKSLSLTAAFFHLVELAILGFASLLQLAPLVVLGGGQYLSDFKLQALAYLFSN
jgi:Domain of unknown function (DUF4386)